MQNTQCYCYCFAHWRCNKRSIVQHE